MVRTRFSKRRTLRIALPSLALCGVLAGVALFGASEASAVDCTPSAATACVAISAGALTFTAPTTLTFPTTQLTTGTQWIYDGKTADQSIAINDARGLLSTDASSGWNVNVTAGAFTCTASSSATCNTDTLGGTFKLNGVTSDNTSTTGPTLGCAVGSTCSTITNAVVYPKTIPTGTSTKIASAAAGGGRGSFVFGDATHPLAWWLSIPPTAEVGTYESTLTISVNAGP